MRLRRCRVMRSFCRSLELNDKAQVAAGSLLNEVRNLAGMVTAFLNFARPQPLHLGEVDLRN